MTGTAPDGPQDEGELTVVAVHPERTGDPATLRWHVPGPALPATDEPHGGPALAGLVETRLLATALVGAQEVTTTLAEGQSWTIAGPAVRRAVQETVAALRSRPARPVAERDAALRELAELVVAGAGPYAASHGGRIELVAVQDDIVSVRLGGACHGCPAQSFTVHRRLEEDLRRGAPWLREVRVVDRRGASDQGAEAADCGAGDGSTTGRPLVLFRTPPARR
ncbi:NifU family protein [Actinotalea sp.]|uniref:NifU family protein n=1 Tax=Actinotalea sp. TaxID=1872145 RepID=UPI0035672B5A